MRVKILKTDDRLGIKEGEIYKAKRYHLDPEKVSLIARETDGYDPCCNQYFNEVAFWMRERWMVVRDGQYVPKELPVVPGY